jgi:small subunit ribosomal protein S4
MGDIKRKRKLFSRPRKLYDSTRIESENQVVKKFGLKNKKEIWKAKSKVSLYRKRAKSLIGKDMETQQKFFEKLNKMGLNVVMISDILALTEEDLLNRRLQTIVFKKKIANSPRQARQLIVHKRILVDGKVVNTPSFLVTKEFEGKISVKAIRLKEKKDETLEVNNDGEE